MEYGYQTVVRFFHKQVFALKYLQPYPDGQDEKKRELFLKELEILYNDPLIYGFKMNPVLRATPCPVVNGIRRAIRPE